MSERERAYKVAFMWASPPVAYFTDADKHNNEYLYQKYPDHCYEDAKYDVKG